MLEVQNKDQTLGSYEGIITRNIHSDCKNYINQEQMPSE